MNQCCFCHEVLPFWCVRFLINSNYLSVQFFTLQMSEPGTTTPVDSTCQNDVVTITTLTSTTVDLLQHGITPTLRNDVSHKIGYHPFKSLRTRPSSIYRQPSVLPCHYHYVLQGVLVIPRTSSSTVDSFSGCQWRCFST